MFKRSRSVVAVSILFLMALASWRLVATAAEEPWEGGAFSGNAKAIATAAQALVGSKEKDTVILFEERRIVLDASSRMVETRRMVYRVGDDVDEWSDVAAYWSPWRQQKPSIRARVIAPDGRQVELDQKTLAAATLREDGDTFGDTSGLRAPLPALTPGSVVETQVITRDSEPLFDRGISYYIPVGHIARTLRAAIVIEAPTGLPLKYATQFLPGVTPTRSVSGGKATIAFQLGPIEKIDYLDLVLETPDQPKLAYVAFSTARSWRDVAEGMSRVVDGQISQSNVTALVRETIAGASDRAETIERLLQKVQRKVRYKAVELGDAAIVPTPPGETLKLEYGDCKDQAALLVAMLRSAGIESYMALLGVADRDPNPDFPGFGAFDHAIVYVPGSTPLWIDSTPGYARAGQLPRQDQNRLALILRPGEEMLSRIPEYDSRSVETREVFLSELGRGRIVEVTEYFGAEELSIRSQYGESDRKEIEEQLRNYVKDAYAAKSMEGLQFTDPKDVATPFRLRLEAKDTAIAMTDLEQAVVAINPSPLLESVRHLGRPSDDPTKQKDQPVVLRERSSVEFRYRIVPPVGFRKGLLPPNKEERFGPAVLSWEFSASPDGTVNALLRFDTGKRRYSAEDVAAVRKGVSKIEDSGVLLVTFENAAEAYMTEGKLREGLAEFRKVATLHPNEALHHAQIAKALLMAGLGEAAREEAQRAVSLDPTSAVAHQIFGIVMEHDLVGVRFKPGWDRAAAMAEYRKAVEADPDGNVSIVNLAVVLEHNEQGVRYGKGADVEGAITQLKLAISKSDDAGEKNLLQNSLAVSLLHMERYADARDAAKTPSVRLAAIAALESPDAALREAGRLLPDPGARQTALVQAGVTLMQLRLYEFSAALMRAGARGASNASQVLAQADRLGRIKRREDITFSNTVPTDVVRRLLAAFYTDATNQEILEMIARPSQEEGAGVDEGRAVAQAMMGAAGMSAGAQEIVADAILGMTETEAEGNDRVGYRVRITAGDLQLPEQHVFVVREDSVYRVLAIGGVIDLALEAVRRLDRDDVEGARQMLDWAKGELRLPAEGDDRRFGLEAFLSIWGNAGTSDPAALRLAASTLLSGTPRGAAQALPVLAAAKNVVTDSATLQRLDIVQATALIQLKRYEESLAIGQRALNGRTRANGFFVVLESLAGLGRLDEVRALLVKRLEEKPQSEGIPGDLRQAIGDAIEVDTNRRIAVLDMVRGNLADSESRFRQLTASQNAQPVDFNNLAWMSLFHDRVTEGDISTALRAVSLSQSKNPSSLHTLAALYAEVGKVSEARQVLLQSLAATGRSPDLADWYVFGRIYEQLGEREAAIAAYRRLITPEKHVDPVSSRALAERRLKTLQVEK